MSSTPDWVWKMRVRAGARLAWCYPNWDTDKIAAFLADLVASYDLGSPLEEVFVLRMLWTGYWAPIHVNAGGAWAEHIELAAPFLGDADIGLFAAHSSKVVAWPQASIFKDRRRVDFAFIGGTTSHPIRLAVELDGFTFHERTPQQAANDRARDRELKIDLGWDVVRFLSSEVMPDGASSALKQVHAFINQRLLSARAEPT
jgi:very-short-patch-repair endonuclease